MDSWKLREEIDHAFSQWYMILLFILLGALVGFVFSFLVPSPYRAIAEIYVGIDIERVNHLEYLIPLAEEEPLNLDDYKNWQLKQVSDITKSDPILEATLAALQQEDPAWEDTGLADFRKIVDIYWYDTGTWRLEVTHPDQDQAIAAVQTWLNTSHARLTELLELSRTGNAIDQDIWTFNLAISDIRTDRSYCQRILTSIDEIALSLEEMSEGDQIDQDTYSELVELSQNLPAVGECGITQTITIPGGDEKINVFVNWISGIQSSLSTSIDQSNQQIAILKEDRDVLLPEFHQYLEDSLGLSANVVLQPETSEPEVQKVYSTEGYTLGGSFIGLMAWFVYFAVGVSTRKEDHGK